MIVGGQRLVGHVEFHRRHQSVEELAIDVAEAQIRLFRRERVPVLSEVWDLYGRPDEAYISEERLMESELYRSIFSKREAKGEARGRVETHREGLPRILAYRLGATDPAVRERVRAETDVDALDAWYEEALLCVDADAARRLAEKIRNAHRP